MAVASKKITKKQATPKAVMAIIDKITDVMQLTDPEDPEYRIGQGVGIYAYYDYDGEPIYVGQTSSSFSDRVSRHLTGQRSDAVGKFILDPFEVAEIALYSIPFVGRVVDANGDPAKPAVKKKLLDPYEHAVYVKLRDESEFGAVLNESPIKDPGGSPPDLPEPVRVRIIPDELWDDRRHADTRLARRASTIARLAQTCSERAVSPGMRRTLLLQAQRLAWLAELRINELGIATPSPEEEPAEVMGDDDE